MKSPDNNILADLYFASEYSSFISSDCSTHLLKLS